MRISRIHGTGFANAREHRDARRHRGVAVAHVAAAGLALALLATGCSSLGKAIDNANKAAAASTDLQGFIRDQLVMLAATSPGSLLLARNLAPVVKKLLARFDRQDLILRMAIYPGEVEAVIGANGEARAVSATYSGTLTVGAPASFHGSRNGIGFSQFVPGVIQQLTELITTKGKVRLASIARFVLTNSLPGGNSGWTIYLTSGSTRFQALVLGDDPQVITPGGTRALS